MYSCYYLTTGAKGSRYSLRHQFEETVSLTDNFGKVTQRTLLRDVFVRALSTNRERAVDLVSGLGHRLGEPLHTLDENARRRLESDAKRTKAYNASRVKRVAARASEQDAYLAKGLYPFGQNKGRPITDCVEENDQGWFEFWLKKGKEEPKSTAGQLAIYLAEHFPEKVKISLLSKEGNGEYFGEVNEKHRRVSVTVVDQYGFDGYYGWTNVIAFATASGEILKYKGSSNLGGVLKKGDSVSLEFVIKKHDDYKGVRETLIKSVKIK